jgi:hypothetical protein
MDDAKPVKKTEYVETRVDDFAVGMFTALGITGKLPDSIVEFYNEVKRRKDRLQPGRLSPEGFAFVSILADLIDEKIPAKKE